jgi:hypothetical protein
MPNICVYILCFLTLEMPKLKLANFKCFMSLYIVQCKLHQGFFFQFYDIKKLTNFPKTLAKLVDLFSLGFFFLTLLFFGWKRDKSCEKKSLRSILQAIVRIFMLFQRSFLHKEKGRWASLQMSETWSSPERHSSEMKCKTELVVIPPLEEPKKENWINSTTADRQLGLLQQTRGKWNLKTGHVIASQVFRFLSWNWHLL